MLVKTRPPNIAPKEKPTFVIMLIAVKEYCLLSIRLEVSKANEDIVVSAPQKPTAINNAYFWSRFHCCESMANEPKMKLPIIFTIRMFIGNTPRNNDGVLVMLNRRKVPAKPPTAKNIISIPFKCTIPHSLFYKI